MASQAHVLEATDHVASAIVHVQAEAPVPIADAPATQAVHATASAVPNVEAVAEAEKEPAAQGLHARSATAVASALKKAPASQAAPCASHACAA